MRPPPPITSNILNISHLPPTTNWGGIGMGDTSTTNLQPQLKGDSRLPHYTTHRRASLSVQAKEPHPLAARHAAAGSGQTSQPALLTKHNRTTRSQPGRWRSVKSNDMVCMSVRICHLSQVGEGTPTCQEGAPTHPEGAPTCPPTTHQEGGTAQDSSRETIASKALGVGLLPTTQHFVFIW